MGREKVTNMERGNWGNSGLPVSGLRGQFDKLQDTRYTFIVIRLWRQEERNPWPLLEPLTTRLCTRTASLLSSSEIPSGLTRLGVNPVVEGSSPSSGAKRRACPVSSVGRAQDS